MVAARTASDRQGAKRIAFLDGLDTDKTRRFPSVRQPVRRIAETAINTLLDRIRHPDAPPRQILLNPEPGTTVKTAQIAT